jgi:hypothetical protein
MAGGLWEIFLLDTASSFLVAFQREKMRHSQKPRVPIHSCSHNDPFLMIRVICHDFRQSLLKLNSPFREATSHHILNVTWNGRIAKTQILV